MSWTSLSRYVRKLPLTVVMPNSELGFSVNNFNGNRYEDAFFELMKHVSSCYNVKTGRENTAVGGLSMGGYGSLKLGLKYPDLFGSVGAHSSAVAIARPDFNADAAHLEMLLRVFGPPDNPGRLKEDPFALAEKADRNRFPALYFDCGTEDQFLADNRKFHELLVQLGLPHRYSEFAGGHDWNYWDRHIQDSLSHHVRVLKIQAEGAI